jgi:hypothetical protein
MTTIARNPDESDWEPRLTLHNGFVVMQWFDGRTDLALDDLRWLVEVAGPAILAAAKNQEER